MFTGIVETVGTVRAVSQDEDGRRLRLAAPGLADDLAVGQSVSVDGVCLTVEAVTAEGFEVFLSRETVDRSTLGDRAAGDACNLERALAADGRFEGHIVQGHVDGTAEITDIESVGEDWWYTFTVPSDLGAYVVPKGSIAIDGISLTVAERDRTHVGVSIIPATYERTTLPDRAVGDRVNVEVDVIAKYVESLVADRPAR